MKASAECLKQCWDPCVAERTATAADKGSDLKKGEFLFKLTHLVHLLLAILVYRNSVLPVEVRIAIILLVLLIHELVLGLALRAQFVIEALVDCLVSLHLVELVVVAVDD